MPHHRSHLRSQAADHAHEHARPEALADLLDRDAALLGGYLGDATGWIQAESAREPERIVDLGAGTGSGGVALAERFERATVVAVDRSAAMLERVRASAAEHNVAARVGTVQADLDEAWPDAASGADLVWASSSLHEVGDPDRVLADAHSALRPGGLLAVIEMDGLPRFLTGDPEAAALETRCHASLADAGWNAYPDWAPHVRQAGFADVRERRFGAQAASVDVLDYARATLTHIRTSAAVQLSAEDRTALDALLGNEAELARVATRVRGARVAWLARRR
ncbi:class I SAM-dependent methyltransferase [Paramicrobacterium humi]|nr:class I SAM-dependent methyltransferase [Microbacterium humi]